MFLKHDGRIVVQLSLGAFGQVLQLYRPDATADPTKSLLDTLTPTSTGRADGERQIMIDVRPVHGLGRPTRPMAPHHPGDLRRNGLATTPPRSHDRDHTPRRNTQTGRDEMTSSLMGKRRSNARTPYVCRVIKPPPPTIVIPPPPIWPPPTLWIDVDVEPNGHGGTRHHLHGEVPWDGIYDYQWQRHSTVLYDGPRHVFPLLAIDKLNHNIWGQIDGICWDTGPMGWGWLTGPDAIPTLWTAPLTLTPYYSYETANQTSRVFSADF